MVHATPEMKITPAVAREIKEATLSAGYLHEEGHGTRGAIPARFEDTIRLPHGITVTDMRRAGLFNGEGFLDLSKLEQVASGIGKGQ